mmetsp:Transcript_41239/g.69011  ORF Transcript_41239/g.69011 Transcript_41239/m.69011 type:complete len:183 (+) Transcript_41239:116-664(+)|eukprot:CAMPEP_0198200454 /NCGR_PEP_ID=MMETSP1445-20131203/3466_1 /TAXON_ID=36898 /ORGANISM="Pyramimonas sp., Strain CCMP2087" /LENGTH=182 /DNA_ID=CAMNT_0043870529 /DNA_START=116 /DNA_END=664 /DNA_ORIENTATION=-
MSGRLERLAEKSAEVKPTKSSSKPNIVPRKEANKELEKAEWEANKYAYIALEDNIWYYRDRASVPRGPAPISTLRTCWINGTIDEHTLVWGQGLEEWVPLRNVRALPALIRNLETVTLTWLNRVQSAFLPQRAARQPAFKSAPASTKAKGTGKKSIKKPIEKKNLQVAPATACLSLAFPMQN